MKKEIAMNKELYVVTESGEVVDKIESQDHYVKLSEGDKIVRKGALNYLQDTTDIRYHFVKINPLIFDKYCRRYSILPTLVSHIGYMDNVISWSNGKRINIKSLPKLCEVSESTIKRQLKQMIEEDLIHKIKDGNNTYLVMSPWVCMRGRRIYLSLYEEFKLSSIRDDVEEWQK